MTTLPPADEDADARRESLLHLNRSTRELIEQIRLTRAPATVLEEARAALERAKQLLSPHVSDGPVAQAGMDGDSPNLRPGEPIEAIFPFSPIVGPHNPIAPPIRFSVEDGIVHGRVSWGAAYCGPPNHVHGGMLAAAFDELLGTVNVVNQVGAMTGTLTIRYRRPTPLYREIRLEGRTTGTEGRKVFAAGSMWDGDELLAEAEGIFISINEDFRAYMLDRSAPELDEPR